jgi:hypothetical protein
LQTIAITVHKKGKKEYIMKRNSNTISKSSTTKQKQNKIGNKNRHTHMQTHTHTQTNKRKKENIIGGWGRIISRKKERKKTSKKLINIDSS